MLIFKVFILFIVSVRFNNSKMTILIFSHAITKILKKKEIAEICRHIVTIYGTRMWNGK